MKTLSSTPKSRPNLKPSCCSGLEPDSQPVPPSHTRSCRPASASPLALAGAPGFPLQDICRGRQFLVIVKAAVHEARQSRLEPKAARFHQPCSRSVYILRRMPPSTSVRNSTGATCLHARTLRTSPSSGQAANKFLIEINSYCLPLKGSVAKTMTAFNMRANGITSSKDYNLQMETL